RRLPRLRIWSAACSTGEEPYSIAMLLHDRLAGSRFDIDIVASDLSTKALNRAQAGVWPIEKTKNIPPAYLRRYMEQAVGPEAGKARMGHTAREMISFERINLLANRYPVVGAFDVIFCRNVLIYFDAFTREQVIQRLLGRLVPGGYLFLGHAESLVTGPQQGRPRSV